MNKKSEIDILSDIEKGYDLIAEKFSLTRAFMWQDLEFVKDLVKPGDRVLDYGCGNGRLAGYLEGTYKDFVGVDISQKLIDLAKQRYHSEKTEFIKIHPVKSREAGAPPAQFNRASFQFKKLPFKDNYFDVIFSIAVFHHFPSEEYAIDVIKELRRVLKPDGKIVITVWNLWQKQYLKYHKKSKKEWLEAEIPFKAGNKIFNRYHHPFKMGELKALFREAGFKALKTKEGWNLVYIGRK